MNAIDADLRVLGLAVPDAPAQSLDLRDDHRLRRPSRRVLVRQHAGDLLQVLQPHGDVEPVEHRRRGDAGVGQDAPEPGAAVGEGGQRRVPGPADGVEGAVDQRPNVRVGLRDSAENLSSAGLCFDIADPDLEVPLAVLAAADEG